MGDNSMASEVDQIGQLHAVWFFLPLPHPLPVPHAWQSVQPAKVHEGLRMGYPWRSSLVIHQVERAYSQHIDDVMELAAVANQAMDFENPQPGSTKHPPLSNQRLLPDEVKEHLATIRTIAEVAVNGVKGESKEETLAALDSAIEHVRLVQRSIALGTEYPVRLLSREMLPPFVPIYTGHFPLPSETDGGERIPPQDLLADILFVEGASGPTALSLKPAEASPDQLERVSAGEEQLIKRQAFEVYIDLRREAMVQRHLDGNRRMAVIALAMAGEVLLVSRSRSCWVFS